MKLIRIRLAQPILHAAALAAFFMPMSSIAQPVCGDRSGLLTRLGEKFHEVPVALGLTASGQVWDDETRALFAAILSFWFGHRALKSFQGA